MAEEAGRAMSSARFAFEEYGDEKPPVLNTIVTDEYTEFAFTIDTIRKSFKSFDDYLNDTGKGLGRFLDTVDVFAGDLISLGDGMQEAMADFRKTLSQSVAFGNLAQWGETVGAVVGQLAGGGGLLGGASAGVGGILGSLVPGAGPVGQAIGAALLPAITDGFKGLFSDVDEAATQAATGGRRIQVRTTHNHIGQVVAEIDAVLTEKADVEELMDEVGQRLEQKLHELSV